MSDLENQPIAVIDDKPDTSKMSNEEKITFCCHHVYFQSVRRKL